MEDSGARKRWGAPQGSKVPLSVKPTQPRAQDAYDQYLAMLQERNR